MRPLRAHRAFQAARATCLLFALLLARDRHLGRGGSNPPNRPPRRPWALALHGSKRHGSAEGKQQTRRAVAGGKSATTRTAPRLSRRARHPASADAHGTPPQPGVTTHSRLILTTCALGAGHSETTGALGGWRCLHMARQSKRRGVGARLGRQGLWSTCGAGAPAPAPRRLRPIPTTTCTHKTYTRP